MKKTVATLLVSVLAALCYGQGARQYLKLGDRAPDFALPNGDGKLVGLSEMLTRAPVLVVFYRGYW